MIVSRKNFWNGWVNSEDSLSRLSGPYHNYRYKVNNSWHRLYGRSFRKFWDLNNKDLDDFKET